MPVEHDQLLGLEDIKSSLLLQLTDDRLSSELKSLRFSVDADAENHVVREWLQWCHAHPNVKPMEANVPSAILPGAVLVDIKVEGPGRQPEDLIYNENGDIRRWVARGNCVLLLPGQRHLCLVHALKKFTGGIGDDDDDQANGDASTWRRYFLRPVGAASRLVLTQKANGETAHLSARLVDGAFLVCVGSKNVHLALRSESDVALYVGPRYRVAREVAAAVWRLLAAMEARQRQRLLSFLHHTRFTAVLELLQPDNQIVQDLDHPEEAELRFIAWTPTFARESESLCGCSPELGLRLAGMLGLRPVAHSVETGDVLSRLPRLVQEVRQGYGYEGKVVYFVDDDGIVIGLLKTKTAWYIYLRALRELMYGGLKKLSFVELKANIEKKFLTIQTWLDVDDQFVNGWLSLGVSFAEWLKNRPDTDYKTLRTMMASKWSQFLRTTGRTDKLEIHATG